MIGVGNKKKNNQPTKHHMIGISNKIIGRELTSTRASGRDAQKCRSLKQPNSIRLKKRSERMTNLIASAHTHDRVERIQHAMYEHFEFKREREIG